MIEHHILSIKRDREKWIRDKNQIDTEMNAKLVLMKKRATTSGRFFQHIQVQSLKNESN